jgi:hypothetical protein
MAARDAYSPKAQRKLLGRIGDDLQVLERLQLADIASMAPDVARDKTREALDYHSLLASTGTAEPSVRPSAPEGDDAADSGPRPPRASQAEGERTPTAG